MYFCILNLSSNQRIPFLLCDTYCPKLTYYFGFLLIFQANEVWLFVEHLETFGSEFKQLCVCVLSCSVVSDSLQPHWSVALQAPLSVGFPRQEYWSRLPFPLPEGLPDPGMEPASLVSPVLAGRLFTTAPLGKPWTVY